jgi:hypothetical protein
MDYVTRQFINLAKKLRAELRKLLSELHSALQKQTEAIREFSRAVTAKNSVPPEITTVVHLPENIKVTKGEPDATKDEGYQRATLWLSALTLVSVVVYSTLVWLQYREMINATGASQAAVNEARHNRLEAEKALDAAIKQSQLDQRAWVGLAEVVKMDAPKFGRGPKLSFKFVNSGKTPAREVKTKLDWDSSPGNTPPVCKNVPRPQFDGPSIPPQGSYTLNEPSASPFYIENTTGGIQYWEKVVSDDMNFYCINGEISYADIFSEARHTTHFCVFENAGSPKGFTYCGYQNDMN